ncbi:hypothetical protein TWF102_008072 [Orbilia oligospora]|uniref:Uncharacterized protein n=1 Tax=Orbilia oligospora TaxID=2813651 RepID=A0A7C8NJ14_ORBOL|nr:hypothetical protein TWF706_009809 [Orbilia oligospora]KAF3091853.1 hypothetical protein TWF103_011415 [Orbilia oligospora]KAF3110495.1 hypothetical protein TWF102_008072 [Orbilia oligospora]
MSLLPQTPPKTVLTTKLMRFKEKEQSKEELITRIEDLTRENGILRKQIQEFHELWSSVQNLITQTSKGVTNLSQALENFDSAYEYAEANWALFWDTTEQYAKML